VPVTDFSPLVSKFTFQYLLRNSGRMYCQHDLSLSIRGPGRPLGEEGAFLAGSGAVPLVTGKGRMGHAGRCFRT
jgi:hypothetical protein